MHKCYFVDLGGQLMIVFRMLVFLKFFTLLSVSHADNEDRSTGFFPTLGEELASPYTTKAWPWVVGGVATTALLASVLEDSIVDPTQEEFIEHRPLGSLSSIGDYGGQLVPNFLYTAGMYIHYLSTDDRKSLQRSMLMVKASLYSTGITTGLKPLVGEKRPNGSNSTLSFPSGHTTAAFAFSSYVMAEHSFWPWGLGALALSSLTAASRINDNAHYLHDVAGGATIGIAYGLGLHYLYSNSEDNLYSENSKKFDFMVVPVYEVEFKGLSLTMSF